MVKPGIFLLKLTLKLNIFLSYRIHDPHAHIDDKGHVHYSWSHLRIVQWSSNVSVNTLSIVESILLHCVCCDYFFVTENTEFIVIYVQEEKLARN